MKIKTIDIELAIMDYFKFNRQLIVPNLSYTFLFETDMVVISKSGYAHGFEIKVSKSDLKNDLSKPHIANLDKFVFGKTGFERWFRKFKHFSYAVSSDLEEEALNQIPDFFGLYTLSVTESSYPLFKEIKKPKKLFNYKLNDKEIYNIQRLAAMRIYGLKSKIRDLKN